MIFYVSNKALSEIFLSIRNALLLLVYLPSGELLLGKVGDEVFLKSILNSTKTIVRRRFQSLDPNDLVGGTDIGPE
ncbi:hypothetical protein Hanom_Chr15g01378461 [Helianthus anomalus]